MRFPLGALWPNHHTPNEIRTDEAGPGPIWPRCRPDWIPTLGACWFSTWAGARVGIATCLPSIALVVHTSTSEQAVLDHGKSFGCWLVVLGAASLAACAQSSVVSQKSEHRASRQASPQRDRMTSSVKTGALGGREKAYPVRAAQRCRRHEDSLAGGCQLLHRGNGDRDGEKFDTNDLNRGGIRRCRSAHDCA